MSGSQEEQPTPADLSSDEIQQQARRNLWKLAISAYPGAVLMTWSLDKIENSNNMLEVVKRSPVATAALIGGACLFSYGLSATRQVRQPEINRLKAEEE